jgi:hypothetical protein
MHGIERRLTHIKRTHEILLKKNYHHFYYFCCYLLYWDVNDERQIDWKSTSYNFSYFKYSLENWDCFKLASMFSLTHTGRARGIYDRNWKILLSNQTPRWSLSLSSSLPLSADCMNVFERVCVCVCVFVCADVMKRKTKKKGN